MYSDGAPGQAPHPAMYSERTATGARHKQARVPVKSNPAAVLAAIRWVDDVRGVLCKGVRTAQVPQNDKRDADVRPTILDRYPFHGCQAHGVIYFTPAGVLTSWITRYAPIENPVPVEILTFRIGDKPGSGRKLINATQLIAGDPVRFFHFLHSGC